MAIPTEGECAKKFDVLFKDQKKPDLSTADPLLERLRNAAMKRAKVLCGEHIDNRPNSNLPALYFASVENPELGMWAIYERPMHAGFICVHTGTLALFYDLFYRLLAHPDVLPEIGNVGLEKKSEPYCREGLFQDYEKLIGSRAGSPVGISDVLPIDPLRRKYAERLAEHAWDFLVFHELAHITFGHCEYADVHLGISQMSELGAYGKQASPPTKRMKNQAIESAADGHAAITTWLRRLQTISESDLSARARLDRSPGLIIPLELYMFDWAFAVYIMFWIFGEHDISGPQAMEYNKYPTHRLRMIRAFTGIQNLVNIEAPPDALAQMQRATQKAINSAGMALMAITDGQLAASLDEAAVLWETGVFDQHWAKIAAVWHSIKDDVAKYAHAPM